MRIAIVAGVVGLGGYAAASYLGATWGSTREERCRELPSDGLVPQPAS
jgi:hypothetical protein